MKNFHKIILIISIVFISQTNNILAQSNILHGMRHLPQSINNNPARQPECKAFIGFPVLSNVYVDVHNTGFVFNDIFDPHPTLKDSFIYTLDDLENAMKKTNYVNAEFNTAIINFGFSLPNNFYLTFSLSTKANESFTYPRALAELKNGNYRGADTLSFHFGQNLTVYNEFAFGISKRFYNNLTLGVRLKYLSGIINTRTENFQVDWYTEANTDSMYEWKFNSNFDLKTSAPVGWKVTYGNDGIISGIESDVFDIGKALGTLFNNHGAAVDFGAEYNLYNKLILSASVVDLGVINWVTNPRSLTQKGLFRFSGIDAEKYVGSLNALLNLSTSALGDSIRQDFTDTLMSFINPTFKPITSYRTSLNPKFYAGANYFVTKWLDVGFLYRGVYYDKKLWSSYTASLNANFLKAWSVSASWSYLDELYNNVGFGFSYRVGLFQWYFMTDNVIPYFWAANESAFSDNLIRSTKRANFMFGFNLLLNRNKIDHGLME